MTGWCACPHRWRRDGRGQDEDLHPTSLYRCEICGKRLKRKAEVGFWSGEPHLYCGATGDYSACTWPGCVDAPRAIPKRVGDRMRSLAWTVIGYADPD